MKKFFSILQEKNKRNIKAFRKSKGQSFVEFILLLPILIMLFTGMVEFGFLLNTYLNLLDATRQSARFYSNYNPLALSETDLDGNTFYDDYIDDTSFYQGAVLAVTSYLAPDADTNKIVLNPATDNVLISVVAISVNETTDTIVGITRYPSGGTWALYPSGENTTTEFSDQDIEDLMTEDGSTPVRTGILIVEVFYDYAGTLKLPWLEIFYSQPVTLRAYSIMPLVAVKPAKVE